MRLLPTLATGVLALSLLGPVTAVADDARPTGPALPDQAAAAAEEHAGEVLDEAQAVFEERSPAAARRLLARGGGEATMALNQLLRVRGDLSASERRQADALLARPTDGDGGAFGDTYTVPEQPPVCGDNVCIHYVETTGDAPVMTDDDLDDIPDSVEQALATAEEVNDTYVAAGYRRPFGDGTAGNDDPTDPVDMVDIYLSNLGDQGLYGYCAADDTSGGRPFHRAAYCGIDDDFAEFPDHTPLENQQVTLAHEYYHAVQFAYDAFEDPWIMEATATWAEDELFDDIDDNRQYLPDSQLARPKSPLDRYTDGLGRYHYGNWVFFRYLSERWTARTGTLPTILLDVWKRLDARKRSAPDDYSTQALQAVLAARGTSFTTVYGQFASANRTPEKSYEEGAAYPVAAPISRWTLTKSTRSTGGRTAKLDHLTSAPYRFTPGDSLGRSDWRLRLTVDMPSGVTAPVARVTTHFEDGRVATRGIRLRDKRASTKTFGFSSPEVSYVELVLVNASRRVRDCWTDPFVDVYACYGRSRDNNRRTDFRASVYRS